MRHLNSENLPELGGSLRKLHILWFLPIRKAQAYTVSFTWQALRENLNLAKNRKSGPSGDLVYHLHLVYQSAASSKSVALRWLDSDVQ